MNNAIAQTAEDYAEKVLGKEGFQYISAVIKTYLNPCFSRGRHRTTERCNARIIFFYAF
jgi:hypothetical protein